MGTTIRPEVSKKNPVWISRHRYYELKHFCMQYQEWEEKLKDISYLKPTDNEIRSTDPSDPVAMIASEREIYSRNIALVNKIAKEVDPVLGIYVLKGITYGISYDLLHARVGIPCGKEKYYELYRRFFWALDRARDA